MTVWEGFRKLCVTGFCLYGIFCLLQDGLRWLVLTFAYRGEVGMLWP